MFSWFEGVTHDTRFWVTMICCQDMMPVVLCPNGEQPASMTTLQFARDGAMRIVINAGLYDSTAFHNTNKPEGIVVCDGNVLQNKPTETHPGSMPLAIDSKGTLKHGNADDDAHMLVANGIKHAVCGFMPIITDGQKADESQWPNVRHFTRPHARQVIGQAKNGDYRIVTTEGCPNDDDSRGLTIAELQDLCLEHGLWYAYNLDGGTSTATVIDGKQINPRYRTSEGRVVPTYIGFVPR